MRSMVVICGWFLVVGGCVYKSELPPEIIMERGPISPALVQPRLARPAPPIKASPSLNVPPQWLVPSHIEKTWTAVIIHHSGTGNGNAAIFDRWHREGNNWDGVGYDFVIGNGTDSGDGEVEVTFRWREQRTGAHCKTPDNWANEEAVGICLVGDFNSAAPTPKQIQSLIKLIDFLQKRYRIPAGRVYGHNGTPGARTTDCPGRNFPMGRVRSMLGS